MHLQPAQVNDSRLEIMLPSEPGDRNRLIMEIYFSFAYVYLVAFATR